MENGSYLFLFISAKMFSAMLFRSTSIFSTIAVRPSPLRSFSRISNLGPSPASTLISPVIKNKKINKKTNKIEEKRREEKLN
jgi:hypothetical protein